MSTWILLAIAALAGCGELVDGDFRGEALAELIGNVVVEEGAETPGGELRVGLFWAGDDAGQLYEQDVLTELEFPARYTLSVFNPPPDEAFREGDRLDGAFAIGVPLIYQDSNRNNRLEIDDELVVGAAVEVALVFTTDDLEVVVDWDDDDDEDSEIELEELAPGFHTLEVEVALCTQEAWLPLELAAIDEADILVGAYEDQLVDIDCDEDDDEWWEESCEEECDGDGDCLRECEDEDEEDEDED